MARMASQRHLEDHDQTSPGSLNLRNLVRLVTNFTDSRNHRPNSNLEVSRNQRQRASLSDNPDSSYPESDEANERSPRPNASSKSLEGKHDQDRGNRAKLPTWHPFWLRPGVLGVFSFVLLCCLIAILVMMDISKRNDGLVPARLDLDMLWRFAPTAGMLPYKPPFPDVLR